LPDPDRRGYDLSKPNACFGGTSMAGQGNAVAEHRRPQPPVVGASLISKQSGQFVTLTNPAGTTRRVAALHPAPRGSRLESPGRSTGPRRKRGSSGSRIRGRGTITATLDGVAINACASSATRPIPATSMAYNASAIGGTYKRAPRSVCFGG